MKWQRYHTIWLLMLLGWTIAYTDRNLLSPIVAYMIANKIAFFKDVAAPHALAGLMSTLFFAGYMAMQFPAGMIGDRVGRKPILVLSLAWAAVGTVLTGMLAFSMFGLLAARVLTGLGEGCYYSNDRALISEVTPPNLMGLGMGVSFAGLGLGLVGASVGGAWTLSWAVKVWGPEVGWYMPFYVMAVPTVIVTIMFLLILKKDYGSGAAYKKSADGSFLPGQPYYLMALKSTSGYIALFFVLIMAVAYAGVILGMSEVGVAICILFIALGIMLAIMTKLNKHVGAVFFNKNLQLVYWGALPTLWSLWFYSFWGVKVIGDAAKSGINKSAVTAAIFGVAALVGLPLMGWFGDWCARKGYGRKVALMVAMALHTACIFGLGIYLMVGGQSLLMLGLLVFGAGTFLFGIWSVSFALTTTFAPPALMASAFGVWNLIAEIGAILSPVVSGVMRDASGSWVSPIFLDGALMVLGIICIALVNEKQGINANVTAGH
jgi:MFS family permease